MLADLATSVRQRPKDVKAAVGTLYPDLGPATLDALFAAEANGWNTVPLTPSRLAHEIAVLKAIGLPVPADGNFDPAAMIAPS